MSWEGAPSGGTGLGKCMEAGRHDPHQGRPQPDLRGTIYIAHTVKGAPGVVQWVALTQGGWDRLSWLQQRTGGKTGM